MCLHKRRKFKKIRLISRPAVTKKLTLCFRGNGIELFKFHNIFIDTKRKSIENRILII